MSWPRQLTALEFKIKNLRKITGGLKVTLLKFFDLALYNGKAIKYNR